MASGVWEMRESDEAKEGGRKVDGPGDIRNVLIDLVRM